MARGGDDQARFYKDRLEQMLKTIPQSVRDGSYQKSVSYKEAVEAAKKALKTPGSLPKLQQAHSLLSVFYQQ